MLLCVVGPTACFKSDTAIQLAERFGGEIISCDSVSVYKDLDIGSAKPASADRNRVPHHLIDIADPKDRTFSVSSYKKYADQAIMNCELRDVIPIVCGGSGLYFDSIMHDMQYNCASDPSMRTRLNLEYDENPRIFMEKLRSVDKQSAERIPINDKKRLVRAMEVFNLTGKPFSDSNLDYINAQQQFRYESVRVGLNLPREALYERINRRVDMMMQNGLLEEVESLRSSGLDLSFPAMQSIGYKQLLMYMDGVYSLSEAVEEIKKATRHLAKRQITWFRRDSEMTWFDCSDYEHTVSSIISYVQERIYADI